MTAAIVEVVRRFWDLVAVRREFEPATAFVHDDAEFDWSGSRAPYAGVYRGASEGRQLWSTWLEAWDEWIPEITETIEVDPATVILVTSVVARGKGSGVTVQAGGASLWQVRDGRIAYAKLFQSKEEALAAVSPPAT